MKRNRIAVLVALALVVTGAWYFRGAEAAEAAPYRLVTVERGNLESTVSATGTLGAVTTVQVGTQVSGKVTELLVDFNDRVRKGQLIARIDPTLQLQTVRDAEANLERSRAELELAEREYQRNLTLYERKVLTETEFNDVEYNLAVARANLKSAQVSVERARQNLAYTEIYAPIDGIVVERNVEPGQTVAASLSAPQLFLIANDLARMQILASVDESDIGRIREGQPARFTVQAYPDEAFEGTVRQVRLQSTTTENVVNYTVVVEVENRNGRLLPGMTASVDFTVEGAEDVLFVPNTAIRFRPTEEMLAQVGEASGAAGTSGGAHGAPADGARPAGGRQGGEGGEGGFTGRSGGRSGGPAAIARLWYVDESGKLALARVRTGISDGKSTVVEGEALREGMQVIAGVNSTTEEGATNPFQQQGERTGFRPGGF